MVPIITQSGFRIMSVVSTLSHSSLKEKVLRQVITYRVGPVKCHHVSPCRRFTFRAVGSEQIVSFQTILASRISCARYRFSFSPLGFVFEPRGFSSVWLHGDGTEEVNFSF